MTDTPVAKNCTAVVEFDTVFGKIDTASCFLFAMIIPFSVNLSARFI